jgi:hypothetical protein
VPEVIDEVYDAPRPERCPDCDVDLIEMRIAARFLERTSGLADL